MNKHKAETIALRKQYVKSCEHDVQFALNQIDFFKKYLKDCRKYLQKAKASVKEAEKWKD